MNPKPRSSSAHKKQQTEGAKVTGGIQQKKSTTKIQASGNAKAKKNAFQDITPSKYCWQSNDMEHLPNMAEKPKQKN